MLTRLPLTPEADSIDAPFLAFSEASVETGIVLLVEPIELLVPLVEVLVDELGELGELEELEAAFVGLKVSCPTAKPTFAA
jgi:hypothetical protein